jgi:nucleotide-binding universal stress UspA family protein
MPFKSLLVHLDPTERSLQRLRIAIAMALRHEARLTGLYVKDLSVAQVARQRTAELGLYPAGELNKVVGLFDTLIETGAGQAREQFERAAQAAGVQAEWLCEAGRADEIVPRRARSVDLCILGQWKPEMENLPYLPHLIEQVLFLSGRPTLIIPGTEGPAESGRHVLVGWDGSRAAARAVHDALPIIAAAEHTTVLTVNAAEGRGAGGEDIARHLTAHGARVTTARIQVETSNVGQAILHYAATIKADMVMTGCYGHSRLREFILGGVTRTLLHQSALPVLMSC